MHVNSTTFYVIFDYLLIAIQSITTESPISQSDALFCLLTVESVQTEKPGNQTTCMYDDV